MFIPNPNFFHHGSRIRIKEFKYFNPKNCFLRSRKYDPGCSFRIRILIFYSSRIPDPGVKKAPDPGSRIRNTAVPTYRTSPAVSAHKLDGVMRFLTLLHTRSVGTQPDAAEAAGQGGTGGDGQAGDSQQVRNTYILFLPA
jgi:hypothetical protein